MAVIWKRRERIGVLRCSDLTERYLRVNWRTEDLSRNPLSRLCFSRPSSILLPVSLQHFSTYFINPSLRPSSSFSPSFFILLPVLLFPSPRTSLSFSPSFFILLPVPLQSFSSYFIDPSPRPSLSFSPSSSILLPVLLHPSPCPFSTLLPVLIQSFSLSLYNPSPRPSLSFSPSHFNTFPLTSSILLPVPLESFAMETEIFSCSKVYIDCLSPHQTTILLPVLL